MESTPAAVPPYPLAQRIWGVFASPRRVFESLRARPRVLGALVILVVVNVVASVLILDLIAEGQRAAMESKAEMSPEQVEKAVGLIKATTPLFAVLGNFAVIFLLAAIYLFLSNILLGGSTTYKKMLSGVAHIGMVSIPAGIVKIPLMLSKGTADVTLSPAAFLSSEGDKGFVYHLLLQFDLFNLWMIGLGVLVVSVMGGVPMKKATTSVIAMWAVIFLIFAPIAAKLGGAAS